MPVLVCRCPESVTASLYCTEAGPVYVTWVDRAAVISPNTVRPKTVLVAVPVLNDDITAPCLERTRTPAPTNA